VKSDGSYLRAAVEADVLSDPNSPFVFDETLSIGSIALLSAQGILLASNAARYKPVRCFGNIESI